MKRNDLADLAQLMVLLPILLCIGWIVCAMVWVLWQVAPWAAAGVVWIIGWIVTYVITCDDPGGW
jgi:hypothetical protein